MSESGHEPQRRVLVGIDLTERSRGAFARALELARALSAHLVLVHVTSDALPGPLATAHETYAREVLRDLVARAKDAGLAAVEHVLVRGRDYELLIEEARARGADLIVIGTHRPSSLVQDMLGTTADRLLRHGGKPLLLVRSAPAGPYNSILVAVDFSPASRRALELALGWFPKAERIAAVTAYGSSRRTILGEDAAEREAAAQTRRLALKGLLDEIGRELGAELAPVLGRVTPVVERGWAEDVILRTAEETRPDLLVVGTHARGGLQKAVLGSVAEWVLAEAPCDVLAVPPAR